jgi:CBS domain-containing protein
VQCVGGAPLPETVGGLMGGALAVPTARDLMARNLVTFTPETLLFDAVASLLEKDISGAPVVDRDGRLIGLLSEFDCLRVIAAGEFYDYGYYAETTVADVMTQPDHTIDPSLDLWAIAGEFVRHRVRRLPVLENGRLIGQVSRRDLLAALDRDRRRRKPAKRYPDYPQGREPRDR